MGNLRTVVRTKHCVKTSSKMIRFAIFVILALLPFALAYPSYQYEFPNGGSVPNPCGGGAWLGVGHLNPRGSGAKNPFGDDFAAANHVWTKALCQKDSDGDGKTNGQELGDPDCKWDGDNTGFARPTGHPGICEPVGSATCASQNFAC